MRLFSELLDLVLPLRCAGCGDAPGLLCTACLGLLSRPPRHAIPSPAPPGLPLPWAAAGYEGAVRAMIVAHKESGRTALATPLGEALARTIQAATTPEPSTADTGATPPPPRAAEATGDCVPSARAVAAGEPLLVVAVPSTRAAVRRRGYDATERITAVAVAVLRAEGVSVRRVAALTHARRVADQAGLTTADRVANLAGALRVIRPDHVAGRRVIVVDDVITTGATIAEAARALRAAGADVPAAAVVAATKRRYGPG